MTSSKLRRATASTAAALLLVGGGLGLTSCGDDDVDTDDEVENIDEGISDTQSETDTDLNVEDPSDEGGDGPRDATDLDDGEED